MTLLEGHDDPAYRAAVPALPASPGLILFELLVRRREVTLPELFEDAALPPLRLVSASRKIGFRWRLVLAGDTGPLVQAGLPPALIHALGLREDMRPGLRQALAEQWMAPLLPALRCLFAQAIQVFIDEAPDDWGGDEEWAEFHLTIPPLDQSLPGRLASAFVLALRDWVEQRMPVATGETRVRAFAGTQLRLPVAATLCLQQGDVLLGDETLAELVRQIHLYRAPQARSEARYLATVDLHQGRIERVASGSWWQGSLAQVERDEPCVAAHVVMGMLQLSSPSCEKLVVGQCIDDWQSVHWLQAPQLHIAGRLCAHLQPTLAAGQAGYQIAEILQPE